MTALESIVAQTPKPNAVLAELLEHRAIVRMLDLAMGFKESGRQIGLFLVAPDKRAEEVRAQLRRPAFSQVQHSTFFYVPYGELIKHADAMSKFGQGLKAIEAIAQRLNA